MKDELDKRLQLMTISVIIPVYNASATLFHCLESLDRQTDLQKLGAATGRRL